MIEPLISVIIPVYKVEAYLHKCVDSVLSQTYQNLEVILVDDGSPDSCGQICDEYARQDSRVKVIHKENGGLGYARNSGMEIAHGEYLMFVDSDDFLTPDAVQVLCERLIADGSDMAVGKHTDYYEDGTTNDAFCAWMQNAVISKEDVFSSIGEQHRIAVVAWAKLYRKELFDNLRYPALKCSEDLGIFPKLINRCGKISIVDHFVYYYLQRGTSILHQLTDVRILDDLRASMDFVRFLYDNGYQKGARWWFVVKLDWAMRLCDKKAGCDLIAGMFTHQELCSLLRGTGVKTRVKWMALHNPLVNQCVQSIERIVKRG